MTLAPALFIPHGGGPMPLLAEPGHQKLVSFLQEVPQQLPRPQAILVISAHWEQAEIGITYKSPPSLLYDYYGFPPASYEIRYPAPAAIDLANDILHLLKSNNLNSTLDKTRGLDHGVFVPLKLMYPEADIPVVQMSLLDNLDARAHISIGQALRQLRSQNILILGSGYSFHNLPVLLSGNGQTAPESHAFHNWLRDVCCNPAYNSDQRLEMLANWHKAPGATYCHPRAEHLLPLHVCAAMSSQPAQAVFDDEVYYQRSLGLLWQA